jgi:hypothetical protein
VVAGETLLINIGPNRVLREPRELTEFVAPAVSVPQ